MTSLHVSRRAMALPMVLVVLALVGVAVGALHFLMQAGVERTGRVRRDTEHLYLGEAVLANIVNNLKKQPWELRFYARGAGAPPCSQVQNGAYHGATYTAVVEDVVDKATGRVLPNLTDVLLQVTYKDLSRNFFARVSVTYPTVLRPTNVTIERFTPVEQDVTDAAQRAAVVDQASADLALRRASVADTSVVAREVAALAAGGVGSADQLQQQVTVAPLAATSAIEGQVRELWQQGHDALASGKAGMYTTAFDRFKAARDLALTEPPLHRDATAPRSLMYMAQARVGEFEAAQNAMTGAVDHPKDDPAIKALAVDALAMLEQVLATYPSSEDVPYALLGQAKIYRKLDDRASADAKLRKLAQDFPDLHLWGEDPTVAGTSPADGVVPYMQALLDPEGDFWLSRNERPDGVGQVYFINEDDLKVRVTNDPRPKDRLTVAPDGARLAYRAQQPDGTYQIVALDFDGSRFTDVTSAPGAWQPAWAPLATQLPFSPVYWEAAPAEDETTVPLDLSGFPPCQAPPPLTLEGLLVYARGLHAALLAAPYDVFPPKIVQAKCHIDLAQGFADGSKGASLPSLKEHFVQLAANKVMDAVVLLEAVKADFAAGQGARWQFNP